MNCNTNLTLLFARAVAAWYTWQHEAGGVIFLLL